MISREVLEFHCKFSQWHPMHSQLASEFCSSLLWMWLMAISSTSWDFTVFQTSKVSLLNIVRLLHLWMKIQFCVTPCILDEISQLWFWFPIQILFILTCIITNVARSSMTKKKCDSSFSIRTYTNVTQFFFHPIKFMWMKWLLNGTIES